MIIIINPRIGRHGLHEPMARAVGYQDRDAEGSLYEQVVVHFRAVFGGGKSASIGRSLCKESCALKLATMTVDTEIVKRPALLQQLDAAGQVTIVSAAAGSGKTVLLRSC